MSHGWEAVRVRGGKDTRGKGRQTGKAGGSGECRGRREPSEQNREEGSKRGMEGGKEILKVIVMIANTLSIDSSLKLYKILTMPISTFNPENNSWGSFPLSCHFLWIKNNNNKKTLKIIETLTGIRTHRLFFGGFRWKKEGKS